MDVGTRALKLIARQVFSCLLLLVAACTSKKETNNVPEDHAVRTELIPVSWQGEFSNKQVVVWRKDLKDQIARLSTSVPTNQMLVAMSNCSSCRTDSAKILLPRLLNKHGALPQIFVPSVRKEVQNNSTIKMLGGLGAIGDLLKGALASDDKITSEIRSGISAKGKEAIRSVDLLRDAPQFWFDGFTSLSAEHADNSFTTIDMASKWAYVTSLPQMWEGQEPLLYGNHGAQMLAFVSVISDWNYLYGLQSDSANRPFGGLVFDPRKGNSKATTAMDLRAKDSSPYIFSGRYKVTFDKSLRLVDVTTKSQEKWSRDIAPVPLGEQALILLSAARAMHYFRPKSSGQFPGFFTDPGFFPKEAIQVPLVHLAGAGYMLDGQFINPDTRQIFATASLNGPIGDEADLESKMRLSQALIAWLAELKSIGDLKQNPIYAIDNKFATQLSDGRNKMELAAQAVLQSIVGQNLIIEQRGGDAKITVIKDKSGRMASISEQLELSYTLLANEKLFSSPFIAARAITVFNAVAKNLGENDGQLKDDLVGLSWLGAAIEQAKVTIDDEQLKSWPWFEQLYEIYVPKGIAAVNAEKETGP